MSNKTEVGNSVLVDLVCNRQEGQSEGVNWTGKGSVGSGDLVLDDEGNWLCPVCGGVGMIKVIEDIRQADATETMVDIAEVPWAETNETLQEL